MKKKDLRTIRSRSLEFNLLKDIEESLAQNNKIDFVTRLYVIDTYDKKNKKYVLIDKKYEAFVSQDVWHLSPKDMIPLNNKRVPLKKIIASKDYHIVHGCNRLKKKNIHYINQCPLDNRFENLIVNNIPLRKSLSSYYNVYCKNNTYMSIVMINNFTKYKIDECDTPILCAEMSDAFIVRNKLKEQMLNFPNKYPDYNSQCEDNYFKIKSISSHTEIFPPYAINFITTKMTNNIKCIFERNIYEKIKDHTFMIIDERLYYAMIHKFRPVNKDVIQKDNFFDYRYMKLNI